ncbi:MAG: Ig domain-containing protein [bacterium]
MAKRARNREMNILNNTSFLDAMSNTVGALAFLLLLVVLVTVALKLNYFELNIKTEKLPDAVVGKEYNVVLAGTGGNEPYKWSKLEGDLPRGLDFIVVEETVIDEYNRSHTTASGKIYGIPRAPTRNPVKLTFQLDDSPVLVDEETGEVIDKPPVKKSFSLSVQPKPYKPEPLVIKTETLPTAIVGSSYVIALAAVGGYPPYSWEKEGDLAPGLDFDMSNGKISGVPLESGEWNITLKAKDSMGTVSKSSPKITLKAIVHKKEEDIIEGIIKKLRITTSKIPNAVVSEEYSLTLAATGGIPPYRWSLSGNLPTGLEFDHTNGRISGVPNAEVSGLDFTVTVMNDEDAPTSDQDTKKFTITVKPAPAEIYPLTIF